MDNYGSSERVKTKESAPSLDLGTDHRKADLIVKNKGMTIKSNETSGILTNKINS